jgi:hypothetical protein
VFYINADLLTKFSAFCSTTDDAIHVPHVSKFQNANKMPTISVCYALQSVPENINIKKKNSPQITLYQYNAQRIYQMFFITHQPETYKFLNF